MLMLTTFGSVAMGTLVILIAGCRYILREINSQ